MPIFNKVAIVGVGLIGGSIGLAMKKNGLAGKIVGVARHKKTILRAKKEGAIDAGSKDLRIIKGADLVILAVPIEDIIGLAPAISGLIAKNSIVSDVGSTKEEVVKKLNKLFPNYIGAHPLAGSEKRGVSNASAGLFNGSLCILTPLKNSNRFALKKTGLLWKRLGAKVILASPQEHDRMLSLVSHLPHLAAFSLVNSLPEGYLKFAAGGFKDTTRIAASDAGIWSDIFLSNRRNLIRAVNIFEKNLSRIKSAISQRKKGSLSRLLGAAKTKREKLK